MTEELYKTQYPALQINNPKLSNWTCYMFGNRPGGVGIMYTPEEGRVPNGFVRFMMWICFDCKWVKKDTLLTVTRAPEIFFKMPYNNFNYTIETMKQDTNRATGRTTGLMLQAIGRAVENPGTEVEFIDHHEQNHAQLQYCKERIEKIAKQLNLDVSVNNWTRVNTNNTADFGLYVKSNWVSPYSQNKAAEEKWKEIYGYYPMTDDTDGDWENFQAGYKSAQKDYKVGEWEPTPQTPEQTEQGLKEAFREAVKQGVVSSSTKPQNLTDLIYDWWEDVFTTHSDLNMEASIETLVDEISLWLPTEHDTNSHKWNECIRMIREKLR